ncbi:MAG: amino acid adenylation domain-containing protein, partial [Cyanobacteria bacterium P01_A01_bin.135]
LLVLHHIIADGWSRGVLLRELTALYRSFCDGTPSDLSPLPIQYADYTLWQQQWLGSDASRAQLDYWRSQLANLPALELPSDRPRPAVPDFTSRTCTLALNADTVTAAEAFSRCEGVTLFTLLLTIFTLLLHRYSAHDDIGVGVPVANRSRPELEPLIGFFVNTLVLRTRLTGELTFRGLLLQVKATAAEAIARQELPFAKVVEVLQPERDLSQNPLFRVMFQLQSGYQLQNAASADLLPGLNLQQTWIDPQQTKFDMTWHGIEREEGLLLAVEYRVDLFDETRIQRMLDHFQTLLQSAIAAPDCRLADLSLLCPAERHRLLVEWNQTQAPLPAQSVHQRFEAQAAATPEAIAVITDQPLTYRELNHRANQLAHTLQAQGIGPESLVGLYLHRSADLMVALLGVLKAGAAYLPIDPNLPAERVRFILDDAQVARVVTAGLKPPDGPPVLDLADGALEAPSHNPAIPVEPENLAYVIYTSGSTGRPKGTLLTHQGLSNYLSWAARTYKTDGGAPVQSSIGFDATITSLFVPLLTGQPVTLIPDTSGVQELEALHQALTGGDRFGFVKLTPSHLRALEPLMGEDTLVPGQQPTFILGGEALKGRDLAFWQRRFPHSRFVNEYGPTEAVVGCCVYEVPLGFDGEAVPIGRPIDNVQLYMLDPDLELVPVGVPGELYIGGVGVARGYLNRPDLTAERFIPNPFAAPPNNSTLIPIDLPQSAPVRASGRSPLPMPMNGPPILYKTGDRARYRPDGTLEYLGRMDEQLKLRGYRIEPGEIEAALQQHPAVAQTAVALRDVGDAAKLVAYVVPTAELEPLFLKTHLTQHLPAYMVPD